MTLSEAVVLGLLKQGVRKYFAIFGHGSTDLGNILRIYEEEGATRTINCRNEVEMAHAATALRWQYGELSAVVTSIGPGAMQAFAGSLASASNGVGVYHIYGDETTFGEGYNMQQVPKEEQGLFGRMTAVMGQSYVLHTPEGLRDAMRRGALCVNHPYRAGPFYLLLPLNTQPATVTVNLAALPGGLRCQSSRRLMMTRRSGRRDDCQIRQGRDQGRRRNARTRCRSQAAGGGRWRCRGAFPWLDWRAAGRACAEYACRRLQRIDQRQFCDGGSRTPDCHRLARGLPGGLFRHRLQKRASRDQHQRRPCRCSSLQQDPCSGRRYFSRCRPPCGEIGIHRRGKEQERLAQGVRCQES
jgi:hypothetical protein